MKQLISKSFMIQRPLLNIHVACGMSIKYWRVQPWKKYETLIVFDDMIADIISNQKKLNEMVTGQFTRRRKLSILSISTIFITQFYFAVPNIVRQSYTITKIFIIKIPNKQQLQQNAFNWFIRDWLWRVYESL